MASDCIGQLQVRFFFDNCILQRNAIDKVYLQTYIHLFLFFILKISTLLQVLEIKTTSQWATLSRSMIEHLLDQESHSQTWRSFDFHMQTSVIPDESYLSTFALNSPMKSQTHHVGLYWLKRFSGQTKYNLCKHLGDADFCGQVGMSKKGIINRQCQPCSILFFNQNQYL